MKPKIILLTLALGTSTCLLSAQDTNPPSDGQQPPPAGGGPGFGNDHGGPGNRGGFHLLPPGAEWKLNLTADQKKQLAALEAETKTRLAAILTPDQMKQLQQMHPPRRQGGFGGPPDGPGAGGPDGGQGGPDGSGGEGQQPPPGSGQ